MAASIPGDSASVDTFIAKWLGQEGGQERANYALFLTEFCDALGLDHPDVASASHETNDYVFESVVHGPHCIYSCKNAWQNSPVR